ncbi:hypothetical protein DGWBC_0637 [Dehalogenimonas sp. WBC-2]|nr:hypothetical protein DGWBC_0637 [Dehalogenimonas sp. WBC-2]
MEIPFSIPVTGVIHLDGDKITIIVNRAETIVDLPFPNRSRQILKPASGKSTDSLILEVARKYVKKYQTNRFSGPDLFKVAVEINPGLNKRTFLSRMVAVTPNHSSYHHFPSGKDYLERIGKGQYQLTEPYLPDPVTPAIRPIRL